ncbi:MAG: UDP-3-O-acyl-N-acetylglucosamine deacetylase [Rhabdochlamydiaceae bacterium]
MYSRSDKDVSSFKLQKTIKKSFSIKGKGLFNGEEVCMHIHPASIDHGILFRRIDVLTPQDIPVKLSFVKETPRCTILGANQSIVSTVEHFLAAVKALEIDNLLIEINNQEVPILDGSSFEFIQSFLDVGISVQMAQTPIYQLKHPVYWSHKDVHICALPSDVYQISYTLDYPSSLIGSQFFSLKLDSHSFIQEIAKARTFSLYEEIQPFIQQGLIKGGGLENAVIVKEDQVLNPGGLRYPNEMVRHKILDMIGDLSIIGFPFTAHVISIKSGHASNIAFAKQLELYFNTEK